MNRFGSRDPIWSVVVLIALSCTPELLLQIADAEWTPPNTWRFLAYRYGAFDSTLLRGADPVYAVQPVAMFFSYALLHGGWLHLLVNMVTLLSIGRPIVRQIGAGQFVLAYTLCAASGAAAFGLLNSSPVPMVGASGALFGLLGIWICWGYLDRRHYGDGLRDIYRALAILVAYNVVFWFLLAGQLAWETHLGGFVAGWLIALVQGRPIYRRRKRSIKDQ